MGVLAVGPRGAVRLGLAALFCTAGVLHFVYPEPFELIVPAYLPLHRELVLASGFFELLGGAGLLAPSRRVRRAAGWGMAALLIAVFPANINMAMNDLGLPGLLGNPLVRWLRLPFQPLLVWGVLWCVGPYSRPHHRGRRTTA